MADLLLPPRSRLIHIGPSKTGSTAIQAALFHKRDQLAEFGVLNASGGQVRAREAGWFVLGGRVPVGRPAPRADAWNELRSEVEAAGDLRVVHSNEDYARATEDEVQTIVGDLGGDAPHVLFVVRRIDALLPSYWSERVKAREVRGYEDWLRVVLAEHSSDWQWKNFHYSQGVGAMVERWSREVGKDNMTLVVLDPNDRQRLPQVFEQMLGLPEGFIDPPKHQSNRSLTYPEAELLRRINQVARSEQWSGQDYLRFVQGALVKGLRHDAAGGSGRDRWPAVPEWARERVAHLAESQAKEVQESGVRILGDASTLRGVEASRSRSETVEAVDLETAVQSVVAVIHKSQAILKRKERRIKSQKMPVARGTDAVALAQTPTRELIRVIGRRVRTRLSS